ncbi:MAG: MOSC domain-containing protein [Deltaproteobacteria bacterium]|nr:MOSC domain-containing protein [Deltaproteobacteria bacterium]
MMRITELYLYPVKSCRGISVSSVHVGRRGPTGDRRFMVVDDAGEFITQRQEPRLALVDATFAEDRLAKYERSKLPRAHPSSRPTSNGRRASSICPTSPSARLIPSTAGPETSSLS